jgi:hypothetical protein
MAIDNASPLDQIGLLCSAAAHNFRLGLGLATVNFAAFCTNVLNFGGFYPLYCTQEPKPLQGTGAHFLQRDCCTLGHVG